MKTPDLAAAIPRRSSVPVAWAQVACAALFAGGGCGDGPADDDMSPADDDATAADDDSSPPDDDADPDDDVAGDDDVAPGGLEVIDEDTTWPASGTPRELAWDVYVAPGVTLTVEAGLEVRVYPEVSVYVEGVLAAAGPPSGGPSFVPATAFRWGSFQFAGVDPSDLDGARIEGGGLVVRSGLPSISDCALVDASLTVYDRASIQVERCSFEVISADSEHLDAVRLTDGGNLVVRTSTIRGFHAGIVVYGSGEVGEALEIEDVSVEDASWMGVVATDVEVRADRLEVRGAAGTGVYATGSWGEVSGSYLTGNGSAGLYGDAGSAGLDVVSSDITNNTGYGILGAGVVRGCYVAGNTGAEVGEVQAVLVAGSEDGVQDAYGTQVLDVDAIVEPSEVPVTLGPG